MLDGLHHLDVRVAVLRGDCRVVLGGLPDGSVHSCVTDPPYEIGFMGKGHDSSGVAFDPVTWGEVLRVLKPGGHLVAFGATRSYHRMVVAIEDAGFEIRDTIMAWGHGEGFPKSQNVGKAIGRFAGPERWEGWGTALKPAVEPIVLARKPLVGTVVQNVLGHGTGALNIDATRIATGAEDAAALTRYERSTTRGFKAGGIYGDGSPALTPASPVGRWPANLVLVHDPDCRPTGTTRRVKGGKASEASGGFGGGMFGDGSPDRVGGGYVNADRVEETEQWVCVHGCPVRMIDQQSGERSGGGAIVAPPGAPLGGNGTYGDMAIRHPFAGYDDTGGASRFFARFGHAIDEQIAADGPIRYVAKAGAKERPSYIDSDGNRVAHSTVKPLALIRYLVKLVTPPGGTVLDPFTGSGTTAEAAILEGMRFIGCELTEAYLPLIDQRIARGYRGGPAYPDPVASGATVEPDPGALTLFD